MLSNFNKVMGCGHYGDCIMTDVVCDDSLVDVVACSVCFNYLASVNQPACSASNKQITINNTYKPPYIILALLVIGLSVWIWTFVVLAVKL